MGYRVSLENAKQNKNGNDISHTHIFHMRFDMVEQKFSRTTLLFYIQRYLYQDTDYGTVCLCMNYGTV